MQKKTSLFDFTHDMTEKLWCQICKTRSDVLGMDDNIVRLACGHGDLRDSAVRAEELHKWNLRYGWPNGEGGFFDMEGYPDTKEMLRRIEHLPSIEKTIKKKMGKKWKAK